ncbi:MAG: ABC transporter ATP-binding protein [Candidatus Aenigmatarchaeota archaeon]
MKVEIRVQNVEKSFGAQKILDSISFSVNKGQFVSIIGPNACGKSTLLYLIQRFISCSGGEIITNGRTGFIFQDHNLFPWKTVKQNIELGPISRGDPTSKTENITKRLLKEVNLLGFENHFPHQLSGSMKQRTGLARCLANNPRILLMDEPFSSLDYLTRLKMQDFITKLWKKRKLTILLVTHDIEEAIKLSDKIIVLSEQPAKILDIIKVTPKNKNSKIKKRILQLIYS